MDGAAFGIKTEIVFKESTYELLHNIRNNVLVESLLKNHSTPPSFVMLQYLFSR